MKYKKESEMTAEQIEKKRARHKIYMQEKYKNDNEFKNKHKEQVKKYKQKNKFLILSRFYGIPENEIAFVFERAKGKCEICGSMEKLVFDHCHKANSARGVLCSKCNLVLGRLGDSLENIQKFVDYLS